MEEYNIYIKHVQTIVPRSLIQILLFVFGMGLLGTHDDKELVVLAPLARC